MSTITATVGLALASGASTPFLLKGNILQEALKSNPSAIIDLYEADFASVGEPAQFLRFYNGTTYNFQNIVWKGNVYTAFPIAFSGFEWEGSGKLPTPKMAGSNIGGFMSALNIQYNDLIGVKITRIRTFLKYLDKVNFPGGVNPDADPLAEFPKEIYYVDRKVNENASMAEYELASAMDLTNSKLPRRTIAQNICMWKYKSPECGYWWSASFDEYGNPTTAENDKCGKRLSDCKVRFYATTYFAKTLNFGGFPGSGLMR